MDVIDTLMPRRLPRPDGKRSVGRPPVPGSKRRHGTRPSVSSRFPVLIGLEVMPGLPNLRSRRVRDFLEECFVLGGERPGFRLVHYALRRNCVLFIVEAQNRHALAQGMRGLMIRMARGLNKLWERKGTVWADRYADRRLENPAEVRRALELLFADPVSRPGMGSSGSRLGVDPYGSGAWFDGWTGVDPEQLEPTRPRPVARPRSRMLRKEWKQHGLIAPAG